jgi:hypothetical protein
MLSLLLWSMTLVVTVQYVCVALARLSRRGRHVALASQIGEKRKAPRWLKQAALWAAIVGTGFVIGDGCLTPAISILSSVEGIAVFAEDLAPADRAGRAASFSGASLPRSASARRASAFLFGPITVVWFLAVGAIGIWQMTESSAGSGAGVVGVESGARRRHIRAPRLPRLAGARLRRADDHRRRGDVCRPRPLWRVADSRRVARRSCFRVCCSTTSARARLCCRRRDARASPRRSSRRCRATCCGR